MILYHRTNRNAAERILQEGFRAGEGRYMTARTFSGVWLSNVPLDQNEGAVGNVLLKVHVNFPAKELRFWEWQEEGKGYREFLIPASVLNPSVTKLSVAEGCVRDFRRATDVFEAKVTRISAENFNKRPAWRR